MLRRCPECAFGDIDMNAKGDGRWKVEWYAVPCDVADSSLRYDIVVSSYYWFSLVVSNTRCSQPCLLLCCLSSHIVQSRPAPWKCPCSVCAMRLHLSCGTGDTGMGLKKA